MAVHKKSRIVKKKTEENNAHGRVYYIGINHVRSTYAIFDLQIDQIVDTNGASINTYDWPSRVPFPSYFRYIHKLN